MSNNNFQKISFNKKLLVYFVKLLLIFHLLESPSFSDSEIFHESIINLFLDPIKMQKMAIEGNNYIKNNLDWQKITDILLKKFQILIKETQINN